MKVEGTQEGIVGTKHSHEWLDARIQKSLHGEFYPSFLIFVIGHVQVHASFEASFCCGWLLCAYVKGIVCFWKMFPFFPA